MEAENEAGEFRLIPAEFLNEAAAFRLIPVEFLWK